MGNEHDSWLQDMGVTLEKFEQVKKEAETSVSASLQSTQDSVLSAVGVSPETAQQIKAAEQGVADFEKGREEGRASGSIGLLSALPPVQLAKAADRIANADDPEAEALKIAGEKVDTAAGIGKVFTDPAGSGAQFGEQLGKDAVEARKQGRTAEFAGRLVGHGDVIAATVAAGGGLAGAAEGSAVGATEGGLTAGAEEGVASAESGAGELVDSGLTGPPKTPPPAEPLPLRPTEFPKGPGFRPTEQPPGPAPDFLPGEPNPFEDPLNPRFPRPPRLPSFEPALEAPESPPPDTIPQSRPPEFAPEEAPVDTIRTPDPEPFEPAPSANPQISPLADSVPAPNVENVD